MAKPNAAQVEQAMTRLIEDRELLHAMRLAAMEEAKQRDFAAYRRRIDALLTEMGV